MRKFSQHGGARRGAGRKKKSAKADASPASKFTSSLRLGRESAALWRKIVAEFGIEDPAGQTILRTGLEALERLRAAQAEVARDGITVIDRHGQRKAHPALAVERDARTGLLSAFRLLRLDPGLAT